VIVITSKAFAAGYRTISQQFDNLEVLSNFSVDCTITKVTLAGHTLVHTEGLNN
jgi:hypothetical protein